MKPWLATFGRMNTQLESSFAKPMPCRSDRAYTVVGVVADMHRQGLERQPIAQIFWPYFQRVSSTMDLVIRTSFDPASLANAVRREVHSINKAAPVFNVLPSTSGSTNRWRRADFKVFSWPC